MLTVVMTAMHNAEIPIVLIQMAFQKWPYGPEAMHSILTQYQSLLI